MDQTKDLDHKCLKKMDEDNIDVGDDDQAKPNFFGIKNYLHNFYDHVSIKNPNNYDENDEDFLRNENQRSIWWKMFFFTGFILILLGAAMLIIGFTFTRMKIDIGYQEEMRIIDKSAYVFNECLDQIKIFGLFVFSIGGIIVAASLLLPGLVPTGQEIESEECTHLKLNIDTDDEEETKDCIKNLIPVTEELKVIQPKPDSPPTVVTNSGLKQID